MDNAMPKKKRWSKLIAGAVEDLKRNGIDGIDYDRQRGVVVLTRDAIAIASEGDRAAAAATATSAIARAKHGGTPQ